jgi:hypothetical protein
MHLARLYRCIAISKMEETLKVHPLQMTEKNPVKMRGMSSSRPDAKLQSSQRAGHLAHRILMQDGVEVWLLQKLAKCSSGSKPKWADNSQVPPSEARALREGPCPAS